MRYVSVCSGIEAASVAWHPLGWECAAVSEIEAFPSAVLAHHYPGVPNLGDMTRYADWPDLGPVDLLVGGTPCQSFSVAGLRQGLADPRGNLALVFLGLLDRLRPRWVVWENVPGVLSSSGGRDFGSFLGGLAELGYGWAYRVLDAQYFGVAQRRRRVFVVGYLGDWRPPVAVLFESESLRGDPPPRREAGEGTAHRTAPSLTGSGRGVARPGESRRQDPVIAFDTQQITSKANRTRVAPGLPASTLNAAGQMHVAESITPAVANPLTARMHKGINTTCDEGQTMVAHAIRTAHTAANGQGIAEEVAYTLDQAQGQAIAHTLRGTGHDAGEDGTGRGTPLVAVTTLAIRGRGDGRNLETREDGLANAILTPNGGRDGMGVGAVAYPLDLRNAGRDPEDTRQGSGCNSQDGDPSPILTKAFVPGVAVTLTSGGKGARGYLDPVNDTLVAGVTHAIQERAVSENIENGPGGKGFQPDLAYTLEARNKVQSVQAAMQVRRLTPTECARLQGFPDDYLDIPYRGKPAADGPKYKALGNSMAVPVMAWLGERIAMVDALDEDVS